MNATVAKPSSRSRGLPKSGLPGLPVTSRPPTFTRFTPTITIMVPMTTAGKNRSSLVNSGSATK